MQTFRRLMLGVCLFLLPVNAVTQQEWVARTGLPTDIDHLVAAGGALYLAGVHGVYKSTDEGVSWDRRDSGISVDQFGRSFVHTILATDSVLIVSTWRDTGAMYRSTDDGLAWTRVYTGDVVSDIAAGGKMMYARMLHGFLKSTDAGVHWQPAAPLPSLSILALGANSGKLFLATSDGIQVSDDSAATWGPTGLTGELMVSVVANDSVVFAGSDFGGVYRSTDDGMHWTRGDRDSLFNISLLILGEELYDGTERGVFRSTDAGATWTLIGLTGTPLEPIGAIGSMAGTSGNLFAVTNGGTKLWALPRLEPATVPPDHPLPRRAALHEAYPNPCNATITVSFDLYGQSEVLLRVFDGLGRCVATLVDGDLPAGRHQVRWEHASVASGVYFCRMEAGRTLVTRKLVLMK